MFGHIFSLPYMYFSPCPTCIFICSICFLSPESAVFYLLNGAVFSIIVVSLPRPLSRPTKVADYVFYVRGQGVFYCHFLCLFEILPSKPCFCCTLEDILMTSCSLHFCTHSHALIHYLFSFAPLTHTLSTPICDLPPLYFFFFLHFWRFVLLQLIGENMSLGAISLLKAAHTVLCWPHTNTQLCISHLLFSLSWHYREIKPNQQHAQIHHTTQHRFTQAE